MRPRPKALFVCGSINQTKQMHAVARELDEFDCWFTPYYVDGFLEACRRAHVLDMTIAGHPWSKLCLQYLGEHGLRVDYGGRRFAEEYALVVTCQDAYMPRNIVPRGDRRVVLVQEGITDPENYLYRLVKRFPSLPRWFSGTAATGLSHQYDRFCIASEGYRQLFVEKGCDPKRLIVTGIPNFDNIERYCDNGFPLRGYALVCTSDARETFKRDDRAAFLRRVVAIAAGRQLVFKLYLNENWERSTREIREIAPGAPVYTAGSAEEMVANCEVLIVQFSTLAFVGLALGKEVHAFYPLATLRRLLPWQNGGRSATHIADVCRELCQPMADPGPRYSPIARGFVTQSPHDPHASDSPS